jgi:DNA-binding transcriptional MerR regulator
MLTPELQISELAEKAGVSVRTVRYYLDQGLLPPSENRGRYAVFGEQHLKRLELIRRLKALHLPLEEIKQLLDSASDKEIQQRLEAVSPSSPQKNELGRPLFSQQAELSRGEKEDSPKDPQQPQAPHRLRVQPVRQDLTDKLSEDEDPADQPAYLRASENRRIVLKRSAEEGLTLRKNQASQMLPISLDQIALPEDRDEKPGQAALDYLEALADTQRSVKELKPSLNAFKPSPNRPFSAARDTLSQSAPWQRLELAPGVELHFRDPLDPQTSRLVSELIAFAQNFARKP